MVTDEREDMESVWDVEQYLNKLLTLMLAYAKAGAKPVKNPITEEYGCDQCKVVQVPLDVVIRYYFRAKDKSHQSLRNISARQKVFNWLVDRDEQERSLWVERFRNTKEDLGAIIQAKMESRDSMWQPLGKPDAATNSNSSQVWTDQQMQFQPATKGKGKGKGAKDKGAGSANVVPGRFARSFQNGTILCPDYQQNQCWNNFCPKGRHLCAYVLPSGRICGGTHPAVHCPSRNKGTGKAGKDKSKGKKGKGKY